MSDLDTSAYTPAQEAENQEENYGEQEEPERTRFQIPLDQGRKRKVTNRIDAIREELREEDNELRQKFDELEELLDNYDIRKFLRMYIYECDRCGEIFDTKQGIGVHHATNPNCNGEDRPWNAEEPSYTKIRVDNR